MELNFSIISLIGILLIHLIGFVVYVFVNGSKLKDIREDMKEHRGEFKELMLSISTITEKVNNLEKFRDNTLYTSKSPLSLTKEGEKLIRDSKIEEFIKNNKEELFKKIKNKKPQTNYDIQELSREIMESLSKDKRLFKVKEYAFNKGVDFSQILRASGITLRDLYLKNKK